MRVPAGLRHPASREWRGTSRYAPPCYWACRYFPDRRVFNEMPVLLSTVRIMGYAINRGERYGRLVVIREVQKTGADGSRYRAALCRCDCGKEVTPRISSLRSGDAQSCGCSRGQPRYQWKHCPVCGRPAMIRRDRRSCSRRCGYELARVARQAVLPSYDVWHNRVKKARGPASDYACADCGEPAQDWSTVNPFSDDVRVRFQPRCRKCHRHYDGAVGEGNPRAKLTAGKSGSCGPGGRRPHLPAAGRRIRHQRRVRLGGCQRQDMGTCELISALRGESRRGREGSPARAADRRTGPGKRRRVGFTRLTTPLDVRR